MSNATKQFGRIAQVITGTNGNGILVEAPFRIHFKVTKTIGRTPNVAEISMWNLSPATEGLVRGEFDEVLLNAGYGTQAVQLFRGNIRHSDAYKEGPERILKLDCADGDRAFREAKVNLSLSAGTSTSQGLDKLIAQLGSDITKGTVVIQDKKRARGKVYSGMARHFLDHLAADQDAHWSFQDGQLQIIPTSSTLPTEAIVVTSQTGMLAAPVRTDKGIKVRCFLNPRIKPGGKIQLNNNDFKDLVRAQKAKLPGSKPSTGKKAKQSGRLVRLDPQGIYKILRVDHDGDTRSQKWESEVLCVALASTVPAGRAAA